MKEIRVYLVEFTEDIIDSPLLWDDEKFISKAEEQGNVYTLKFFQHEWNIDNLNTNSYIRIL